METGRNWTRRSIEELVEQYMRKHSSGGSVDPDELNAELTLPNTVSYGYLYVPNASSVPSGYSVGIQPCEPHYGHGMHMLLFHMYDSEGQMYSQLGLGVECYSLWDIRYADDSVFTNPFYPYRFGIESNNTPSNIHNQLTMASLTDHLIFLTKGNGSEILKCPADDYIEWKVDSLTATTNNNITAGLTTVAPDASKMQALKTAINDKASDIAEALNLRLTSEWLTVRAYFVSTTSLNVADNELICNLLSTLYPPEVFDADSVIDFDL